MSRSSACERAFKESCWLASRTAFESGTITAGAAAAISARTAVSCESACNSFVRATAAAAIIESVSGRGADRTTGAGSRWARGTTIIETMAVTNVPTLMTPMNAGRCSALRARFCSQTWRGIARRGSVLNAVAGVREVATAD